MAFKDGVLAVFKRLHDVSWPVFFNPKDYDDSDFWHTANTLDTCVDFILEGSRVWKDLGTQRQQVQTMIQDTHKYFRKVYDNQNPPNGPHSPKVWWDDYGWWGIAFTKIYQHFSEIFSGAPAPGVSRDQCLQVARDCWKAMNEYSQDVNKTAKTPIPGGCWNHPPLGGIQNTVTNGLFLVLCARLYQNTHENVFLETTADQYLWFQNWFVTYPLDKKNCPYPTEQEGLFRCLGDNPNIPGKPRYGLVYERAHLPNNPYNNGVAPFPVFSNGQLWTGDQGLLLGGLTAVLALAAQLNGLKVIQERDPELATAKIMALWIAHGIRGLFETAPALPVLHEAPFNQKLIDGFGADYATGKGVMMRYVPDALRSLQLNPESYVTACANAVLTSKGKTDDQVAFQWNDKTDTKIGTNEIKFIEAWRKNQDRRFLPTAQSAGMDALNMAIRYLGK